MKRHVLLLLIALLFAFVAQQSYAAVSVFTNNGGSGDGLWSNPVNWSTGAIPVTGDDVYIYDTCQMDVAPPSINMLYVASGALLLGPNTGIIYTFVAQKILCYGTIDDPAKSFGATINFAFDGVAHKVTGSGVINANLIEKHNALNLSTTVGINSIATVNLHNSGNAILNNYSGTSLNISVTGVLNVVNGSVGVDGSVGPSSGGDINYYIYKKLSIAQTLNLTTDNNVGGGAIFYTAPYSVIVCGQAVSDACGSDGIVITIEEGVTVEFTNIGGGWGAVNMTNRVINVGNYPTIIYSALGDQPVSRISSTVPTSLIFEGSGNKTLMTNYSIPSVGKLEIRDLAIPASAGYSVSYIGNAQLIYNSISPQIMTDVEFPDGAAANIRLINTGTVTLNATKSLTGNLTINSGSILNTQTFSLNFSGYGNIFTNNGTVLGSSTFTFNGPTVIPQTLTGTGAIEGLVINNTKGVNHTGNTTITNKITLTNGNLNNTGVINYVNALIVNAGGSMTDNGVQIYSGTVDLNYTAAVTTTDELPVLSNVINNFAINAPTALATGINVHVNGTITLNSTLDITDNNTLNIYNPIVGLTNLVTDENSTLGITGSSAGIQIPDATIGRINMNNSNGAVLTGNNTVVTDVYFGTGNLYTDVNTLTVTNLYNEDAGTYLVGNAKTPIYGTLNTGTSYLGISFDLNVTGTDIVVLRETGAGKAVTTGSSTGINRTWTLSAAASDIKIAGVLTTMTFTEDDRNSKDMSQVITFEKRVGHTWNPTRSAPVAASNPTPGTWSVTADVGVLADGYAQYDFTVSDSSNVLLPIELISFTGEAIENAIILNWITAMEKNNAFFTILKSDNGDDFFEIGTLMGAGNASTNIEYAYVDPNPLDGINYYLLKQTDFDGKSTESDMIMVAYGQSDIYMLVYPNPIVDKVNIVINSIGRDHGVIAIIDITGQIVMHENVELTKGANTIELNPNLPAGQYVMTCQFNNQKFNASKIIIR